MVISTLLAGRPAAALVPAAVYRGVPVAAPLWLAALAVLAAAAIVASSWRAAPATLPALARGRRR
jgi:hypothetical protein